MADSSSRRHGPHRRSRSSGSPICAAACSTIVSYALLQADVPFELFDLVDIPAVSNQWWAAIVAANARRRSFSTPWTPTAFMVICAATAVLATPRHAIQTQVTRPGADCRRPGCCAPGSPATAFIASSSCGPTRSVPNSSRSIIRAPAICHLVGGTSADTAGVSSWSRIGLRSWSRRLSDSSSVSRRSAAVRWIAMPCASVSSWSINRRRCSTPCAS